MSACDGPPFWGKYRGTVDDPKDPQGLGRVKVSVPDVLGSGTPYALPCAPGAGAGQGILAVPPKGAHVWVEFEQGDPEFPIYSGGFWTTGQAPATLVTDDTTRVWAGKNFTFEVTDTGSAGGGLKLTVKTAQGEALVEATGAGLKVAHLGQSIEFGTTSVKINGTSLEVMK